MPSSTFTNGIDITTVEGQSIVVNDFLVQSDGSYVLFGTATSAAGSVFITSRYNPIGLLDSKFGTKGIVTTDFRGGGAYGQKISSEDSYGRIFAIGSYTATYTPAYSSPPTGMGSVSYDKYGSIADTSMTESPFMPVWGVDVLIKNNNDQIFIGTVGGSPTLTGGEPSKFFVKDHNFGSGQVEIDFGVPAAAAGGLLQKNGDILLFGVAREKASINLDMAFARLNKDGSLDKNFSNDGLLTIDYLGGMDGIFCAVEQDDGKIVAAGTVMKDSKSGVAVVRLNEDGTLDSSFGNGGVATFFSAGDSEATGVHLNKDGSLLISGYATNQKKADFLVIKLDKNGIVDTTFGQNGIVNIDIANGSDKASGAYQLSDGKIIVGGETISESGIGSFALVRLNSDGSLDESFNGAQTVTGTSAAETFTSSSGKDNIDGDNGIDTVVFSGNRASHTIAKTSTGWTVSSASDGVDILSNIERLKFSDITVSLDISGNAGQAYRMYQAAFDRQPDSGGLSFWINYMDHGYTLEQVAREFINSVEFRNLYGANPTTDQFITKLYNNVLHRTPEQAGFDFWVNTVSVGATTREQVLMGFSESAENQANLIGVIGNGIDYTPL